MFDNNNNNLQKINWQFIKHSINMSKSLVDQSKGWRQGEIMKMKTEFYKLLILCQKIN